MRARPRVPVPAVLMAVALLASLVGAGCSGDGGEVEPEDTVPAEIGTVPPTTALSVVFLEVSGLSFCEVAAQVVPSIRVFSDAGADFGDQDVVRATYVGALVAFDALEQVATREIFDDVGLLKRTLADAVDAAVEVDWDLTQVTADAAAGVSSDEVNAALVRLRRYTLERCALDMFDLDPAPTVPLYETPTQKLLRVLSETFPTMPQESLLCLAGRLPIDFDPMDPEFDEDLVLAAMQRCGIDPNAPSRATTTSSTVPDEDSGS